MAAAKGFHQEEAKGREANNLAFSIFDDAGQPIDTRPC